MQEFFNRQVLPAVRPDWEAAAVTIKEMTYKPGAKCEILYSLQFADPARGQSRWVVVTFATKNKLGEIYRHHYGGESSVATRPISSPVAFLPEYECLVEFFPRDWKLPFLARAMDPREMAPLLSQGGPEAERACWLPKVEVVQYRLHRRCTLRYVVDAADGSDPQEVIGKLHNSRPLAVQTAQTQNILRAQAAAYGLIIPKPLRVMQEWGLLLMERVPGTVMKPAVRQARAPQQLKEVIGLAAAALASLHRLRFESPEVQSLQPQVENLHQRAALLLLVAPVLAQQVEALLQQIVQLGARFTATAHTLVHGDFDPGQLLMDKGQMAVIDFDSACVGDPALDVGNFMASLHYTAVLGRASNAFRQLATHFLSEYQARLPEHKVADRIHLFLSVALVRKAVREFERWPYDYGQTGPDSLPVRLLQEAAACLAGTSDKGRVTSERKGLYYV